MINNNFFRVNENTFMITITIASTENCNIANELIKSIEKQFSDSQQTAIEETKPLTLQTKTSDTEKYEDYVRNYFNDNYPPNRHPYFTQSDLRKMWGITRTCVVNYEKDGYISRDMANSTRKNVKYKRQDIINTNIENQFLGRKLKLRYSWEKD